MRIWKFVWNSYACSNSVAKPAQGMMMSTVQMALMAGSSKAV
jgi:hypothetical protein